MARPRKLWSLSLGAHGHRVTVYERKASGPLWLRWWEAALDGGFQGRWRYRALGHPDRMVGERTGRSVAGQLLASTLAAAVGRTTVAEVFAAYERDVAMHLKGAGPKEAARRIKLWTHFLNASREVQTIDHPTLDRYVRERLAGRLIVPGVELRRLPGPRAVEADFTFLQAALNHATKVVRPGGQRLLTTNPAHGYQPPRQKNPRRPVATFDRYLALQSHADGVDPQRLFGAFLALVEGLGWRVSAICQLRACDIDRAERPTTPLGRIHKCGETDKEGSDQWVPMSEDVREAIEALADRHANMGRLLVGGAPLFPAPGGPTRAADDVRPWDRFHARKLLERCETAAKLKPLDGSDFHAFRRKWATERKTMPAQDVAAAGSWRDLRCLQAAYTQTDANTMLAVVTSPIKLRDPAAIKQRAATQ